MSADFTPEKEEYKELPPFKMQVLTNFPYIEADFDALTNYQLLCKVVEYLNAVIYNENEVTDQVTSLYNAYVSLQNYVNNYFDNLNLQNEVNNKLDEMAEDGTLTLLIKGYVDPIYQSYEESINDTIETQNHIITQFQNTVNANIEAIDAKVDEVASGSPLVASSTVGMTDTTRVYVNTTDGKWYYYDGDSWEIGGTYQATAIADGSITRIKLDNGLIYELNKIEDIMSYLPHNKDISISTYNNYISGYAGESATWVGFGVAINNPQMINKIGAPINIGGTGIVRCSLLDTSLSELAHVDVTIPSEDDNQYNFTEFNFNNLDTSDFGSYFYVTFISQTSGKILRRTLGYTLDDESIPSNVDCFCAYNSGTNTWSKLGSSQHLFGLPIILYDNVLTKENISVFDIPPIYKIQFSDDISKTPPTILYLDNILTSKQNCHTENNTDKMYLGVNNTSNLISDVVSGSENHYLYGDNYYNKLCRISTITSKTTNLSNKSATVLQIGDSVTYGAGSQYNTDDKPDKSWAYMAYLGKKYLSDYEQIGDNAWETIILADNTEYTAKAEGHGGWSLYDYLYIQTVNAGGSITANPFYDGTKVWSDSDLNNAGVKFSLNKYLTDKELETPTHVIIQLGFNDTDSLSSSYITNMSYIIKAIKEEYPDMIIGLSLPNAYGTLYNEYYPLLVNNTSGNHTNELVTKLKIWLEDLIELEDTDNDIYYIPNYFVTPTGDSIPTYNIDDKNVAFRSDNGYHPNHKAHVEWGLQQFSWLAYTLLK